MAKYVVMQRNWECQCGRRPGVYHILSGELDVVRTVEYQTGKDSGTESQDTGTGAWCPCKDGNSKVITRPGWSCEGIRNHTFWVCGWHGAPPDTLTATLLQTGNSRNPFHLQCSYSAHYWESTTYVYWKGEMPKAILSIITEHVLKVNLKVRCNTLITGTVYPPGCLHVNHLTHIRIPLQQQNVFYLTWYINPSCQVKCSLLPKVRWPGFSSDCNYHGIY